MDWKVLPALWTCLGTRLCTRIGALPKGPPRARSFVCMESGTIRESPRLGTARRGSAGHHERVAYSRAGCPEGLARTGAGRLDVLECATVPSRNGLDMRAMAAAPPEPFLWRKLAMLSFRALPNRNYRRQPKQRVASVSPALFFGQAGVAGGGGQARGGAVRRGGG